MELVRIIYKGKTKNIYNTVNRDLYEKIYKPKGWRIAEEIEKTAEEKILEELKTNTKIKNYKKMQKVKEQEFDDGLFKKDGE